MFCGIGLSSHTFQNWMERTRPPNVSTQQVSAKVPRLELWALTETHPEASVLGETSATEYTLRG